MRILLLFLTICSLFAANSNADSSDSCNANVLCRTSKEESILLKNSKVPFKREGKVLTLSLPDGKSRLFEDTTDVFFRLRKVLVDQRLGILDVLSHEMSSQRIVSLKSGKVFRIVGTTISSDKAKGFFGDFHESYEAQFVANTARVLFCASEKEDVCSVLKTFDGYAGIDISWTDGSKFTASLSKTSTPETYKEGAFMYSADVFKVECTCSTEACQCDKPKYQFTKGY